MTRSAARGGSRNFTELDDIAAVARSLRLLSIVAPNARGEAVALDGAGNIIIAGVADGAFQVTPGAVNPGTGTSSRAFVMKLSPDGSQVLYAALLGPVVRGKDLNVGNRLENIAGPSLRLAVDADGNAYVAGTAAPGFPTTDGALDRTFGGSSEAFVAKLSADGSALLFSTYLGGAGLDEAHGLAVDAGGRAIVSGTTQSPEFPSTTVLHEGTYSWAFVSRLSSDGSALDFSTLISGSNGAVGRGLALGPTGDIYLSGVTQSTDFPSTAAPFDTPWYVRRAEGFVMRLTADASAIVYSTSLVTGAPDIDNEPGSHMPISVTVDLAGRARVVGTSGAGYSVFARVPLAFEAVVAANGSSFTGGISGDHGQVQVQSAVYDVAGNARGDVARVMTTTNPQDVYAVVPSYGKDPLYDYWGSPEWVDQHNMYEDGVVSWTIAERPPLAANTPAGGTVTVAAADNGASVTFATVGAPGTTTVTPVDAAALNLLLPGGFALSGAAQAYEIHTTASVAGIQVCLNGAAMTAADFANASILHGVNGAWQVEATTRDEATKSLCATVASLSPFAVGVRLDTTAPAISCGAVPSTWTTGPVTITCGAQDPSGLATLADASFALTATVADGVENANVLTGSRQVCDTAGNCATAGPFSVQLDRRRPEIQMTAPVNRRYLLNERAPAAFTCTDAGSGVATCVGTSANGAPVDTTTIGAKSFAVNATDTAGNAAATASVSYTVGFGVKTLFGSDVVKNNKPAALAIRLVDTGGLNVSSAAIRVTAVGLKQLSTGAMITPSRWMYSGPAFAFGLGSYGYALETKHLANGVYELQFTAAGDPLAQTMQFTVR